MNQMPNYMIKILSRNQKEGFPKGLTHVHVYHNDWCDIYKGKPCTCNPDIVYDKDN